MPTLSYMKYKNLHFAELLISLENYQCEWEILFKSGSKKYKYIEYI